MPTALATLAADSGVEAEAQQQQREMIARVVALLFATGTVFSASIAAVLIQLR